MKPGAVWHGVEISASSWSGSMVALQHLLVPAPLCVTFCSHERSWRARCYLVILWLIDFGEFFFKWTFAFMPHSKISWMITFFSDLTRVFYLPNGYRLSESITAAEPGEENQQQCCSTKASPAFQQLDSVDVAACSKFLLPSVGARHRLLTEPSLPLAAKSNWPDFFPGGQLWWVEWISPNL